MLLLLLLWFARLLLQPLTHTLQVLALLTLALLTLALLTLALLTLALLSLAHLTLVFLSPALLLSSCSSRSRSSSSFFFSSSFCKVSPKLSGFSAGVTSLQPVCVCILPFVYIVLYLLNI
jgi:hypothetical protein